MPDAPSSPLVHLQPRELSPAVRGLLQSFVPRGARCLVVGQGNRAMRSWLLGHGCQPVEVPATRAPFAGESFDAALLIGVLHQLVSPDLAALELRRVLRPGGVLLVTATNLSYWRHRLDRATGATDRLAGGVSPPTSGACCSRQLQPGRGGGPGRRLPARPALRRPRLPPPRFRSLPGRRALPPPLCLFESVNSCRANS
jgi:SAM-dependent methyltransferase